MIINLLVLPLAAAYYILTRSYFFKFIYQRLDRQKLFFETVIVASFILVFSFLLKTFFYDVALGSECRSLIRNLNPIHRTPYSGTVLASFILSIALTELSNRVLNKKKQIYRAIKKIGNEFELTASKSFKDQTLILITLKNEKVYVGWVKELPIPSQSNYLRIIPALSGYRDEDKKVVFNSHYLKVYARYIKEGRGQNVKELETDVVIEINEIITISNYDPSLYKELN